MRRALVALAVSAAAIGVVLAGAAPDARTRYDRAIAKVDTLRYVHFEMRGEVRADSPNPEQAPAGGALRQQLTASGDIGFPDRLHLVAPIVSDEEPRELVVVGDQAWSRIGGLWRRIVAGGAQTDPRVLVEVLRGTGDVAFVGYDVVGLVPTYHLRVQLDAGALAERQARIGQTGPELAGTGRLDVFVGVFDEQIHRQEVDIVEQTPPDLAGAGLYRVRTTYAVEYSGFDRPIEIREPQAQ